MLPCQFCGQMSPVDGAGFCTNCRNFRGVPAAPVSGPGYPTTGVPYPTSAPSYGGQQVSSPPYGPVSGGGYPTGYPQPTSYPPAQPVSYPPAQPTAYPAPGAGYAAPGYPATGAPGQPPKQRSPYLIPIVAVSSVVVLLAAAIVAVLLFNGHGKAKPNPPVTQAANGFDQCLVGNWKITQYTAHITFDTVGSVLFTAVDLNETLEIKPDGATVDNYGTASKPTTLHGSGGGHTYQLAIYGTVNFLGHTANNVLSFSDISANGKIKLTIDSKDNSLIDLSVNDDPTPYTCSGKTFTQTTSDFTASASKTS